MQSANYLKAENYSSQNKSTKMIFVTLVMLDDGYIPGALLLGYSLRRQNPEFILACMVTEDISEQGRDVLGVIFDFVIEVEKIFVPCDRMKQSHYLPYVFTKLNALLLCKNGLLPFSPEKVIFIDADVLPLKKYEDLSALDPPAGIINEFKSNYIAVDQTNQYRIKEQTVSSGKWHWHHIYEPICPHGARIPRYITDRVKNNPGNMGVNGALLVLKPSVDEYERIMKDLHKTTARNRILEYSWPEMQYLTARWSGQWTNIDLKYCGLKGYPSLKFLYGTHYAGVKPWKIADGRDDLFDLPDHRAWFDLYVNMFADYAIEFQDYNKGKRVLRAISRLQHRRGQMIEFGPKGRDIRRASAMIGY